MEVDQSMLFQITDFRQNKFYDWDTCVVCVQGLDAVDVVSLMRDNFMI